MHGRDGETGQVKWDKKLVRPLVKRGLWGRGITTVKIPQANNLWS
jgi:hypothetical protein